MDILFATTNPAKLKVYADKLKFEGKLFTLKDLEIDLDVEENGDTPLDNAIIKAKEYSKISGYPTIGMDDGLYFVGVPDDIQPGNNVRRVNGKRLSDEEMIDYYISLVDKYGNDGILDGYFKRGIAVAYKDDIYTFEVKISRTFKNSCSDIRVEGFPLVSIEYDDEHNKYKSELTDAEKKIYNNKEQVDAINFLNKVINEIK